MIMMTHPAAPALRGGIRGRGRHPSPAPEGGRHGRTGAARARARRRAGPRRRSRPSSAGRRPAPAVPDSLQDTTRRQARPGARQRHRRPAGHPHRAHPELRARRLGAHRRSRRGPAISPRATARTRPPCSSRDERVLLEGEALTERQGAHARGGHDPLPARQAACSTPSGNPHLFDRGQVLVGEGIRYDTCRRRGIVNDALTNFTEGSTVWFLRGNVAQDSSSSRIYAGSSEITSCDLPTPHYHFSATRDEVGLEKRAGRAAGGALRAGRADPLAAVHLPGRAAGAPLGHPGAAVRAQRPGPAHADLQPPDHQHRLLLGAERLSGSHRAARLVRQPVCAVRRDRPVPLAQPVHERLGRVQRAAAGRRRIGAHASGGTTGSSSISRPASTSTSTTRATPRSSGRTRSIRCRTPSRSPARSTTPSASAGAR